MRHKLALLSVIAQISTGLTIAQAVINNEVIHESTPFIIACTVLVISDFLLWMLGSTTVLKMLLKAAVINMLLMSCQTGNLHHSFIVMLMIATQVILLFDRISLIRYYDYVENSDK